ncbi:copper chaperone for superoxide dismutase, chloroplastic/cytosolic-like isoform X1 [Chenopodium quinoa]|uniref:copper chaperone for superoxide dismutase, chloroplastic/cytosolic-like isoform X1 n=2 Tax=Chenopodium quinoa TaxID=63459 RepID=UPI000B774E14|nr:copper chaperone for superoxide dismutase, chloroplastic/cytosolic-like isoform X1 [Chenopodium quinoa]
MTILRSIVTTTTAIAATALPAAYVASSLSSSSSSPSSSSSFSKSLDLRFLSPQSPSSSGVAARFGLIKSFSSPPSAVLMENPKEDLKLPELMTEFMVDMKCEGCVSAVKSKLETLEGVKSVEVDLSNQVVRILGSSPVVAMENALEQTGRKARLIGQGVPEDFLVSAAVAEFKGPDIFGVVRFAQTHMELARIEANISGLPPGKHGWSINEFGDLTKGPVSTGKVYNPPIQGSESEPLGDLGTLEVDEKGEAYYSGIKKMLRVVDLIGRSIVLYASEDKSDPGLAAAVIARSAGVGENYKKLCTCDGTTIWEAKPDIVTSKV